MVSKRELGVSYLVAVGVVLCGALTSGWLLRRGDLSLAPTTVLATLMGVMVAGGFSLAGIGLARSELPGERIWHVAKWGTVGLGTPTLALVYLGVFHRPALAGLGWRSVVVLNIAGGGVVGILVGAITELRTEHRRTRALNERNTVFLRLFRHDIRTAVNVVGGHVERITDGGPSSEHSVDAVREQLDHILRLSDAARRLDELEDAQRRRPIDLATLTRDRVDHLGTIHPDAKLETDLPAEAYVYANDLLTSVVDNLLRNAVEHNDDRPWLRVTIRRAAADDAVELRVRDDGTGFSENELAVHARATETALRHSDGIGLWLAKWIVDAFDGEFSIENAPAGGAVATVRLPAAESRPRAGGDG